jgi:hypothetical protein
MGIPYRFAFLRFGPTFFTVLRLSWSVSTVTCKPSRRSGIEVTGAKAVPFLGSLMGVNPTPIPRFCWVVLLRDATQALAVTVRRDSAREKALEGLAAKTNRTQLGPLRDAVNDYLKTHKSGLPPILGRSVPLPRAAR